MIEKWKEKELPSESKEDHFKENVFNAVAYHRESSNIRTENF